MKVYKKFINEVLNDTGLNEIPINLMNEFKKPIDIEIFNACLVN